MMDSGSASAMLDELDRLPADLSPLVESASAQLFESQFDLSSLRHGRVILTGCGDSLHAATAICPAMTSVSGCLVTVSRPRRLIASLERSRRAEAAQLVIGISASGATDAVCDALRMAREAGCITLALVGQPDSPAEAIAHMTLILRPPDKRRGPGIRSYQASAVGLLNIGIRIGHGIRHLSAVDVTRWQERILNVAGPLRETLEGSREIAQAVARETANQPLMLFLAAANHLGTARYCAAKRIEASGLFGSAQDFEESCHVERFAMPIDIPVAIIAPDDETKEEAAHAATIARGIGRRVFVLSDPRAKEVRQHAQKSFDLILPEEALLSPLVSHPVLTRVSAHEADILGRQPFLADLPEIRAGVEAYRRSFRRGD